MMDKFFNLIGEYAPQITFILSLFLLRSKHTLQITYLVGFFINIIIVYILKGLFKEPRPTDDVYSFKLERIYKNAPGFERYGMPSGHAQSVLYSTIFIYYVLRDVKITAFYVILSLFTIFQRVQISEI
jgi:membrane-associated phospholipid phosphatase